MRHFLTNCAGWKVIPYLRQLYADLARFRLIGGKGVKINPVRDGYSIELNVPELRAAGGVTASPTSTGYAGYFTVSAAASGGVVSVFNGADISGGTAGYSDLGSVNGTTLSFASGGSVYLKAVYNSAASTFSQSLVSGTNNFNYYNGSEGYVKIADVTVTSGGIQVAQVWTGGEVYFGERYILNEYT